MLKNLIWENKRFRIHLTMSKIVDEETKGTHLWMVDSCSGTKL
jgi:hypothetical protein